MTRSYIYILQFIYCRVGYFGSKDDLTYFRILLSSTRFN